MSDFGDFLKDHATTFVVLLEHSVNRMKDSIKQDSVTPETKEAFNVSIREFEALAADIKSRMWADFIAKKTS